ncbi:UNVERIFIED_CONTAM: iron complex transport system ATP-binding protein [Acetivibrio alkalicellulosi]
MLSVKNLYYSYGNIDVLKDVTFNVKKGSLCALFGPNGTGKTTLFKCITKLYDIKKQGEILIDNKNIREMKSHQIARIIAYVPQEHKPPFPYTVKEVVLMGRTPHMGGIFGPCKKDIKATIEAMELAGISHLANRLYTNLSGGQRQLVLLARAFAQDTKILLLDEPTSNLDFKNQITLWNTIKKITSKGKTAIICTHDPNHVFWFCDSIILLGREGSIISQGNPIEVLTDKVIHQIYGDFCNVRHYDNRSIVIPSILKSCSNE